MVNYSRETLCGAKLRRVRVDIVGGGVYGRRVYVKKISLGTCSVNKVKTKRDYPDEIPQGREL